MPAYVKLILSGPAPHADQVVDFRHVNGLRAMVYDSLALIRCLRRRCMRIPGRSR